MTDAEAGSEQLTSSSRLHLLGALANKKRIAERRSAKERAELVAEAPDERLDTSIAAELESIRAMLQELHASRSPKERVHGALDAAGLEGALASRLARGGAAAARKGADELNSWLRGRLGKELKVMADPLEQQGRRIILCVGPTGVGKTTTIAKLAARAQFELGKSVLILTVDTYRVGSVAQIQRFASLMGAPFAVASGVSDFCDAMVKHPADVVFIDSASLPPTDAEATRRVTDILQASPGVPVDTLLVLPGMIRGRDAERIARRYQSPKPTGLVISKLDEVERAGGALHASIQMNIPIVYLSGGPRVPEDIETATADGVLDRVFPEMS